MHYQPTPIHCRPWTLSYLSTKLIESHYENNYGGALRRLNAITEELETLDWANTPSHVINGLKRDELSALNSTLLHELYFASMGGDGQPTEAMSAVLARDFGSVLRSPCGLAMPQVAHPTACAQASVDDHNSSV